MPNTHRPRVGVIGGSGLYHMEGVEDLEEVRVTTPFGDPSDAVLVGRLDGQPIAFLPRHGRGHRFAPHEINARANIWALKALGVKWVFSVSAVGSLREDIAPGDLVIIDQFIDRTRARPSTFFEDGVVAHVGFGDPLCPVARGLLLKACAGASALKSHDGGTYVCIDGPQFSTRAESEMHRQWGAAVVGMTNLPEARLAREAELAYATIAMATDYDCWHPGHDHVTVDAVLAVMHANVEKAQRVLRAAATLVADAPPSPAWNALEFAIMTAPGRIPASARGRLALLIEDRLSHMEKKP